MISVFLAGYPKMNAGISTGIINNCRSSMTEEVHRISVVAKNTKTIISLFPIISEKRREMNNKLLRVGVSMEKSSLLDEN